jgi:hypothetical protein
MSAVHIEHATSSHHPWAVFAALERVELATRESDSVSVTLYWAPGTDDVAVTVDDAKTGDSFELVVAPNERALDVFQHPFAYARARGIELHDDVRGGRRGLQS